MASCCEDKTCEITALRASHARVLWIVLAINAVMFAVEGTAGLLAHSTALLADALDMLGDALVYGFSLFVLDRSARWQAGASLAKGAFMLAFGAGVLAAKRNGAAEIIDPRPWAVGEIKDTFDHYAETGPLLPAMGYGRQQMKDLEETINKTECDLVLLATPVDLTRLITINKPSIRIRYGYQDNSTPTLSEVIKEQLPQ